MQSHSNANIKNTLPQDSSPTSPRGPVTASVAWNFDIDNFDPTQPTKKKKLQEQASSSSHDHKSLELSQAQPEDFILADPMFPVTTSTPH